MALALLAQDYVRARGGEVVTLTVDHRLREESTQEAAQVAAWMRARHIPHYILTPEHTEVSRNMQEAARQWRYDALADFCTSHGILHCLVAHHAGDRRETALLHQARGETADGASGMGYVRNYRGVRFLRPMLGFERAELTDFLRQRDVRWIEDPSNYNPKFARVRTRTMLATQDHYAALDAQIAQAGEARAARDEALAAAAVQCVAISPLGFADIALAPWRTLPPLLASQLLADTITMISGDTHRPRAQDTARLMSALGSGFRKRTLQRCEVTQTGDCLRIAREASRVAPPAVLRGRGVFMWDQRFRVHYDLPAGEALTIEALGTEGKRQLQLRDLPRATPCLRALDEQRFVPHMHFPAPPGISVGFAPAKPLAAAPFWWLLRDSTGE